MKLFSGLNQKIKRFFKALHSKKHHLDFLVAMLSVPVLVLAVATNIINLQKSTKPVVVTPAPVQQVVEKPVIVEKSVPSKITGNTVQISPTPVAGCVKQVGPILISYPTEGQLVTDNPVCITIAYDDSKSCSVVWSYRIDGGSWSDYTNNSPCLYNFPKGQVKFDLKVQSTVAQDQTATLTRDFDYEGSSNSTATSSAVLQ